MSSLDFSGTAMAVPAGERDLDLDAVTVTDYVRLGNEFIVTACGGFGSWVDDTSEDRVDVLAPTVQLVFGYGDDRPEVVEPLCAAVERILLRWQVSATPLRLVAAPGALTVLVEDVGKYLPIPRS